LKFTIAPGRVFTPRPATEALVDAALAHIDSRPARVADVGTGAGVIAVTIAVEDPNAEVWATDTNGAAVELARANAERHGVGDRGLRARAVSPRGAGSGLQAPPAAARPDRREVPRRRLGDTLFYVDREVVFVDGVRTAFGRAGEKGVFWRTRADDMGVKVVRELLRRNATLEAERIGDVIFAATAQVGDQGLTLGRDVGLLAGIPKSVPGFAI